MELSDAEKLARSLMDYHGLEHVPLQWHRKTREFGTCQHKRANMWSPWECTAIMLSSGLVRHNSPEQVRDTVLHEIAHAKAGPQAGHGVMWKMQARMIGCDPSPCCGKGVTMIPGKYTASCPCGTPHEFYRLPTRGKICRNCRSRLEIKAR